MSADTSTTWRPEREVELMVGTPAGGGQDRPARALVSVLAAMQLLEVPVRLVNLPGKGGGSAWDYVRARTGNPHVLGISSPPLITNRILGISDYDHDALTPLATLYTEYVAFVARRDAPIDSAAELARRLGADPAGVTIALATALGTTNHIASALIARHAGGDARKLKIEVFDSARYAVAEVMSGHADVAAVTAVSALPEVVAGALRVLAVTAPSRLDAAFAAAPTWSELGVDCVMGTWRGVVGPGRLTASQRAFWDATLSAATAHADWHAELARQFWVSTYMASGECASFLDRERERLRGALAGL